MKTAFVVPVAASITIVVLAITAAAAAQAQQRPADGRLNLLVDRESRDYGSTTDLEIACNGASELPIL